MEVLAGHTYVAPGDHHMVGGGPRRSGRPRPQPGRARELLPTLGRPPLPLDGERVYGDAMTCRRAHRDGARRAGGRARRVRSRRGLSSCRTRRPALCGACRAAIAAVGPRGSHPPGGSHRRAPRRAGEGPPMIARADYETLRKVLLANSGHHLEDGKEYLVERRLESRRREPRLPRPRPRSIGLPAEHDRPERDQARLRGDDHERVALLPRRTSLRPHEGAAPAGAPGAPPCVRGACGSGAPRAPRGRRHTRSPCSSPTTAPPSPVGTIEILGTDYSLQGRRAGPRGRVQPLRGAARPALSRLLIKHFDQKDAGNWQVKDAASAGW